MLDLTKHAQGDGMTDVKGRTAFITGGANGIGLVLRCEHNSAHSTLVGGANVHTSCEDAAPASSGVDEAIRPIYTVRECEHASLH